MLLRDRQRSTAAQGSQLSAGDLLIGFVSDSRWQVALVRDSFRPFATSCCGFMHEMRLLAPLPRPTTLAIAKFHLPVGAHFPSVGTSVGSTTEPVQQRQILR